MRKLLLFVIALSSLFVAALGLATEQRPLNATQIARLESLCRVWGVVKFFHPWIVAPPNGKPIDWDAALVEAIPLVEKAISAEEFRAAIDHLLGALKDPATQDTIPVKKETKDANRPDVEPTLPE